MFNTKSFPQAIVHIEADACFAHFEQAQAERQRLLAILCRFTDSVEEYNSDEGFLNITGLSTPFTSYPDIAEKIRQTVKEELDITISVGLAPTKVLAKLASTANRPDGVGIITQKDLPEYLRDFSIDKIWGVGRNTADYMRRLNIFSAYDFAVLPKKYVLEHFTKPHYNVWQELNGISVYPVIPTEKIEVGWSRAYPRGENSIFGARNATCRSRVLTGGVRPSR